MGYVQNLFILLLLVKTSVLEEYERFSIKEEKQDPHPLVNLGNSLNHRLTTLSSPHGILLVKDLRNYYNLLSDVYRLLTRKDGAEIVKGFKVYNELEKQGGPTHLNVTFDFFKLKRKYNWADSVEVQDVKEIMLLTKELWEDIQDRVVHLRSGRPEPKPVEESTIDWTPFLREVSSGSEVSHY
ncbi:hypothetical protein J6590_058635 [Homalodisca vitripennis]|nr:hypothetical protein J6590_058635 [Homalodisca vitripennis]